jgi:DNA polymerase-1
MKKIDISKYNIVYGVPPVLGKTDRIAIDTEFTGMDKNKLHRVTGEFACATFYFGTDDVYIVQNASELREAFANIEDAGWIFHNAKFDVFHLRRFVRIPPRVKLWDTMLVEQVRFSGLYDEFSLSALVRRYLDVLMEKAVREEFEGHSGEMTQSQVEYACIDAIATYEVFQVQREEIDEDDLAVWKNIELPFMWTLLSVGGIKLDVDKWISIAKENEQKANEVQERWGRKVFNVGKKGQTLKSFTFEGVNLASPKQVKEKLIADGFRVESTDEEALSSLVDKSEFAKDVLEFRTLSKRSGTYGEEFVEKYVEADGTIHSDIFQIGAVTGRTSSRSPNLQNQPREGGYRDCYTAQDGNEVVIADWSAQEPKFAAYITGDEKLMEALNSKEKLYIRIARDAMGIEVQKGSPEYNAMKSTILGLFYGMSAKGLADRIGKSEEEAQGMIDAILTAYPMVGKWIEESQSEFKEYVTSVNGRKIWLNEYNSGWRRAVLNYPIQSSAGDAMKVAANRLVREWDCDGEFLYTNSVLRLLVHDELVCEVPENQVEEFVTFVTNVMVSTAESMHPGIKGGIESFSGKNWGAKN